MELANAAAAPDVDARVGEALLDLPALVPGQARLDAMLVGGAQLDGADADSFADLEQGRQVPGGGDIVGDQAQAELEALVLGKDGSAGQGGHGGGPGVQK